MALNFVVNEAKELSPRITVFGVGGAGGNAVNNMIDKHLEGVEFVVANTDAQALQQSKATARVQMGVRVTEGLGAGARPSVGSAAAEETIEEIIDHLAGSHMCFITAGMGGGTGTGAAPIIAQAARELGVLTVGVVTKPFSFEGNKRMRQAEEGVEALQKVVDTLIIIPNQNLFRLANEKTTFTDAFAMADDVLYQGVKGVTDLMVRPGMINLDFADVRSVMDEMGKAMMGTGEASGEDRARQAAEKAIANPLLDEISLNGARGVLINITGGHDLTLFELDEAANLIREKVDPEANIIVGSTLDPEMEGMIRVSVVATGIEASADAAEMDVPRRRMAAPLQSKPQPEVAPAPEVAYAPEPVYQQEAAYAQRPAQDYDPEPNLFTRSAEPQPQPTRAPQQRFAAPAARDVSREMPADRGYAERQAYEQPRYDAHPQEAQHYAQHGYQPQGYGDNAPQDFDLDEVIDTPQHHEQQRHAAQGANFVAPRARAAGTPSPETLARLQAAVQKAPRNGAPERRAPAPTFEEPRAPQQAPAERGGRFGIGSLISRMAGHGETQGGQHARVQPQVSAYEEDQPAQDTTQERLEIPAFLRRQAN
ncbi:cell division protein FtsZ [Roseicitreum antarcticum]|uniref:Cell division protein FtsZ n=1 Tax=Roseicitreum antarcticum TaxID=564137 RepID=A0A1H2TWN0_9RHOB|nr:cell division protein FtsZ [Roseicitreum antarcticum]SDW48210.1 cell division protein FtsZ [Roseicitreum antarcticum]